MLDWRHGALWGDLAAAGAVVGALIGWLPYLAALLGILWYLVQFWESPLRARWTRRRLRARLARLEREQGKRAEEMERIRAELGRGRGEA